MRDIAQDAEALGRVVMRGNDVIGGYFSNEARPRTYKCPDAIEFGPLRKTSTDKVQKFALREREWGDRKARVGMT